MLTKAIAATTKPDLHGGVLTKEALDSFARHVNGNTPPWVGVQHDLTLPPMGKVLSAKVVPTEEGHHELFHVMEFFDPPQEILLPDGEKLFWQASSEDKRPFAGSLPEEPEELLDVHFDRINFPTDQRLADFKSECMSTGACTLSGGMVRKSLIPDPTLVITLGKGVVAFLTAKKMLDKATDKLLDPVFDDLAKIYPQLKKIVLAYVKSIRDEQRTVTYVFRVPGSPNIEFAAQTSSPDLVLSALVGQKLRLNVLEAHELAKTMGAVKLQYLLSETGEWKFNFLLTGDGKAIGTEQSFARRDVRYKEVEIKTGAAVSLAGNSPDLT